VDATVRRKLSDGVGGNESGGIGEDCVYVVGAVAADRVGEAEADESRHYRSACVSTEGDRSHHGEHAGQHSEERETCKVDGWVGGVCVCVTACIVCDM